MLVNKQDSKVKRMVGDYRKLNQRSFSHAGFLPNMESLVEQLAQNRFKTKVDMRSGFWQIELSKRAQDLTAFVTPSGRVFKWLVMPFRLKNAPAVFQELMEQVLAQMRRKPRVKELNGRGANFGAFFDDGGFGTNSIEDHIQLLEEFFLACQENDLRIKLPKCTFCKEELTYLGFDIGHGFWRPSQKKLAALMNAEISSLKDLKKFLGACNFYRRHVKGFSFTYARLFDKLKTKL